MLGKPRKTRSKVPIDTIVAACILAWNAFRRYYIVRDIHQVSPASFFYFCCLMKSIFVVYLRSCFRLKKRKYDRNSCSEESIEESLSRVPEMHRTRRN